MAKPKVTFDVNLAQKVAMDAAQRGVRAATLEAKRILQVDILSSDPPRTGKVYPRGKDNFHRASAPGESPAPDTGQLRALVQVEFEKNATVAIGRVVSNLEKSAKLELGTEKIAPRPFLSRVPKEFSKRIKEAFDRAAFRGRA